MTVTLWSYDLFDRDSEPLVDAQFVSLIEGLRALWRSVLHEGIVEDGRRSFTDFSLQLEDGKRLTIPVNQSVNVELLQLRARQHEPGFLDALSQRHLELHDRKLDFEFDLLLSIPPPVAVFELSRVLAVALASPGAPVRIGARWRVGAHVEVHCEEPVRWVVTVVGATFSNTAVKFSVTHRYATARWHREYTGDGPETQPLRDALIAAGFSETQRLS
ncbi:MAG: hypothetical protein QM817_05500 [Archangium sp.]